METSNQAPPSPAGAQSANVAAQALTAGVSREERTYPEDQPKPETTEALNNSEKKPHDEAQPGQQQEQPADHDYQLQMPHGVELDQDLLTSAVPVFREAGISNEQANKLIPLVNEVQERFQQSQLDQMSAWQLSWVKEAKADREIGGEHWRETSRLAGIALKAGGAEAVTHEARELLNESGLGNHPAMLRLFRRMGAHIERLERQTGSRGGQASREQRAYPND